MTVTCFKLLAGGALVTDAKESLDSIPVGEGTTPVIGSTVTECVHQLSLRGWEVAADNSETLHELAMERSRKDWMKAVGKQRDGREGIFMRLSEVPTNELHKYLYLYFMLYS